MKICTVTFQAAINYGAVLQTYALQRVFKDMGHECDVLNYECPAIKKADISFDKAYIKNIKNLISSSLYYFINRIKHRKFVRFSKKNISLTQAINTPDKIEKFYDLFVCGSDQVWNYKITNFDKTYFLDFVKDNKKKASYAASFGLSEIPNEYISEYSHLLKSFSHLSVRENEGAKIISDLTGANCETVLDPTLLLSADKWLTLTKEKTEKKPYILIYLMSKSEKLIDFAYKLSIKTGMKVIYISNSLLKVKNFEIKRFSGPEDFLALFKNADFVVTNSFHGIAFSINFNKNFYVDFLPPPAMVNSRIENILSIFNLKDRLVINGEINGSEQIDFNKVNEILEIERRKSLEYIKEIVGYD